MTGKIKISHKRLKSEKDVELSKNVYLNSAEAEYYKNLGLKLKESGNDVEALEMFSKALETDSSLADVHFTIAMMFRLKPELNININKINKSIKNKNLLISSYDTIMAILRKNRQYKEAVICQEEICRLLPKDPLALMDLGLLLNLNGDYESGLLTMSRALVMEPKNKALKNIFAGALHPVNFSKYHPEIKKALNICFENIYDADMSKASPVWISFITKDPVYDYLKKSKIITDKSEFFNWADGIDTKNGKFLNDDYFLNGLRNLIIADPIFEKILTFTRLYIFENIDNLIKGKRIHIFEKFIYALAEQCYLNEYLFYQTQKESDGIKKIDLTDKIFIGLMACYRPIYSFKDETGSILQQPAKDRAFAQLLKTQLYEPMEERRLKLDLPVFGTFANKISQAVKSQYEENPYPRWTTIGTTPAPNDVLFNEKQRKLPFKILVAGCGTGRHAIGTAVRYPNSIVTAIDLSSSSLAYGLRKAKECGLSNRINFFQADILSMKDWSDEFDIIECSGVLHHMQDPLLGWKTLNLKLKPQGLFKIGLYSETARKPIVAAREFIAKHGYPSTPEGIRECRKAIFDLHSDNPMRQGLIRSGDFYATSLVRDLIFHVQEHRMTLLQIKNMMNDIGLRCLKFLVSDPTILYKYDKMFPEDVDRNSFENWEAFENLNPLAFAGMYQFWAQKI